MLFRSDKCNSDGICIVPLEPTDNEEIDGECPHCWNSFRSIINIYQYDDIDITNDEIPVISLHTEDYLPHYRMMSDINEYRINTSNLLSIIENEIQNIFNSLEKLSNQIQQLIKCKYK